MAPKNKFTKEEMIERALRVVRRRGLSALTAKALAEELGTSTQPVFTCFGTMDALRNELRLAAERLYQQYMEAGLREPIPFYGIGRQLIRFAREEPELYRMLFLTPQESGASSVLHALEHAHKEVGPTLMRIYHMDERQADRYFRDMWLVVHGLATLIVTGSCPYSDEEIGDILTGFSLSLCKANREIPGFTDGSFSRDAEFRKLVTG